MFIYKAENIINNKIYIGKTVQKLYKRISKHYYDAFVNNSQTYFHKSIRKYGKENFKWEIIEECSNSYYLDLAEEWYIKTFNSIAPNGYNLTLGGDGASYGDLNPQRIDPKYGERNPFYGKKHSKESKLSMSKKRKGTRIGNENTMIINDIDFSGEKNPFYGKKHCKKTKNMIGNANSDMWLITTPSNEKIEIKNLSKFCKENSLNYSGAKGAFLNNRTYKNEWFFEKII
jgi:group I intron endonuclease